VQTIEHYLDTDQKLPIAVTLCTVPEWSGGYSFVIKSNDASVNPLPLATT
jgi:hypothetical protein